MDPRRPLHRTNAHLTRHKIFGLSTHSGLNSSSVSLTYCIELLLYFTILFTKTWTTSSFAQIRLLGFTPQKQNKTNPTNVVLRSDLFPDCIFLFYRCACVICVACGCGMCEWCECPWVTYCCWCDNGDWPPPPPPPNVCCIRLWSRP